MLKPLPIRRAGMTLVELLVVVAIIGLLAVTVLPNVASTTENRRSREAARVTSSFFAKAQSRAIGRPEWAGVTILPPPTNTAALFAIDLFQANVPQVYRGESYASTATLSGTVWTRTVSYSDGAIPTARSVKKSDLIRFDGRGPWYELTADGGTGVQFRGTPGGVVAANELSGQTERNTPWPTMDTPHAFEILRQPVRNGSAFTIPDGRCVDLAWSGHGSSTYTRFVNAGTPVTVPVVTVLFDATGRVRQIFTQNAAGANRITVTGPVFFLVGRVDRANNDPTLASTYDGKDDTKGFNWQYGDSFWIVIDPASGIVKTSECMPVPSYANPTAGLLLSQQFARSETPSGGK